VGPDELPGPPPDLPRKKIFVQEFDAQLFRTHSVHHNPIFFGNLGFNRFDAPDNSYKVLYAGCDPFCAFIETFARAAGTRVITTTELKNKALAVLKASRPLRLVDLTRSGSLVRMGADARLFSGAYSISQRWSAALHAHPIRADGILYPSRLDPERQAVVLFEDRAPKLTELSRQSWYAPGPQRQLLAEIIEHYGLALIENRVVVGPKPAQRARQARLFPEA
jgi:hypothetical protein